MERNLTNNTMTKVRRDFGFFVGSHSTYYSPKSRLGVTPSPT